jgi:hypothetical protein
MKRSNPLPLLRKVSIQCSLTVAIKTRTLQIYHLQLLATSRIYVAAG